MKWNDHTRRNRTPRKQGRKHLPKQTELVHEDRRTRRKRTRQAQQRAAVEEE